MSSTPLTILIVAVACATAPVGCGGGVKAASVAAAMSSIEGMPNALVGKW